MSWNVVGEFVGKFGVIIAALLAAGGYLWRINVERQRTTRRVLYCLLEIRTATIRQFIDNPSTDAFTRQLIGIEEEHSSGKGHFELKGELYRLPTDHVQDYAVAINELSKDRPLLAAELRGSEKFHTIMQAVLDIYTNHYLVFKKQLKETHSDSKSLQELAKEFAKRMSHEIAEFDILIIRIAKASGLKRRTKRLLSEQTIERYMFSSLNALFSNVDRAKAFKDQAFQDLTVASKPSGERESCTS